VAWSVYMGTGYFARTHPTKTRMRRARKGMPTSEPPAYIRNAGSTRRRGITPDVSVGRSDIAKNIRAARAKAPEPAVSNALNSTSPQIAVAAVTTTMAPAGDANWPVRNSATIADGS
jgi:hypothetical protein